MLIQKTRNVKTPNRGTQKSAGIDFFIPEDLDWESKILRPGESIKIPSGIKCQIPTGYMLCAFNKSGIALSGLQVGACVADEDYQGELSLHMYNYSNKDVLIKAGQKIVQFILVPVFYDSIEIVDKIEFQSSERGSGGFGSTGI